MGTDRNPDLTTPALGRRELILWGAGAALLPAASWGGSPGWEVSPRCADGAIGYCPAPEGAGSGDLPRGVVAAAGLGSGDPLLARRGARLTVHGLVGDVRRLASRGIRSLELRVGFPAPGQPEFRAWRYQLLPVEQTSSAVRFPVPVDGGLRLALEIETFAAERSVSRLVTGRNTGLPKLRAGGYWIALDGGGPVDWRSLRERREPLLALSVAPLDAA